jgi:hypothetical protein
MKLGRFVKASADNLLFNIDYSQWLNSGETITGVPQFVVETVTDSVLVIDGISVINTIGPSGQPSQTMVAFHVSQGLTANTYTVTVTITTSQGQTKEDFMFFSVQDPP